MTRSPDEMTAKERERAFLIGAPLAIIPALGFLPAVMFLIVFPRVAHGRLIGSLVVLACALVGSFGLWKLAFGGRSETLGNFQRSQCGSAASPAGDCRLHGPVPRPDDAEALTTLRQRLFCGP